jgi:FLVCR family feline leukemia virus subgroup C receptor-related protein
MREETNTNNKQQAAAGEGLAELSPSDLAAVTTASRNLVSEIGSIASTLERAQDTKLAMDVVQQQHHHINKQDDGQYDCQGKPIIRPSWKRYVIMLLFCLNSGNKAFQWIQVPAATTKATVLYGVDNYIINLGSILFMMSFVVLSWPACYIIETIGMRRAVLIASFGTALGAIIKCFSCHEEGVWLLMVGQIIVSLCEQFIFSLPSRIASVWFPDNQVSFCVAMCVVGNQVGVAMGFVIPHLFLNHAETQADIGMGFYQMFRWTAGLSLAAFIMCLIAFDEEPKYAPGAARFKQRQLERQAKESGQALGMYKELSQLFRQIAGLCRNGNLIMLALSYGFIVGINYTIQTLLDQMLADANWPDEDMLVATTGFVIIIAGIVTTPIWGMTMDACHAYKRVNVVIALGNVLSMVGFTYAIVAQHSPMTIYITALLYGLFSVGFCVSALEYATELTYPAPELCTSSLMNVMPQIGGTICILIGSFLVDNYGNLVSGAFNVGCLMAGLLLVLVTREDLKRQRAAQERKGSVSIDKLQELASGQLREA